MAETVTDRERNAHARVTRQPIAAIASALQDLFGQRLVAAIAGIRDPKAVGRWIRGRGVIASGFRHRFRRVTTVRLLRLSLAFSWGFPQFPRSDRPAILHSVVTLL